MFDPGLLIGEVLTNNRIVEIFKCGNMGGMRRSKATNTLVLISDYTKGIYHDKWIGGVLHYTGMGKSGDQDIHWAQNATLAEYGRNGVDVHLFEVMTAGEYVYCGRVELVEKPYLDTQLGENNVNRKVWMFPIRPIPENNVEKPAIFVFKDMEDYKAHGKNVDAEYVKLLTEKRKHGEIHMQDQPAISSDASPNLRKKSDDVPTNIIGRKVKHKIYGIGTITDASNAIITVSFNHVGEKRLGYEVCIKNRLLEFI